jgi:hypothetical protein
VTWNIFKLSELICESSACCDLVNTLQIFGLEKSENPSFTSKNFFQVQGCKTQVMPYAVTDEFSEKWLKSIIFTSFTELQESLLMF